MDDEPSAPTPVSTSPKKKGMSMKTILGVLVLILTIVGIAAAYFLTRSSTDIRQQASVGDYSVTCASDQWCASSGSVNGGSFCSYNEGGEIKTKVCCPSGQEGSSGTCVAATGGDDPGNPGGGGGSSDNPAPAVACTAAISNEATYTWDVKTGADRYILRIDKDNQCAGNAIGWFCGTDEGFPNNTGDQYYLLNASEVCSGSTCSVSKPMVSGQDYKGASIQWLNPGDSTDADGSKMGMAPAYNLTCGTSVGACLQLTMTPSAPKFGEAVTLTCAQVAGATSYDFALNVTEWGSTLPTQASNLLNKINNTATFNAAYIGQYQASCSIN